MKSIDLILKKVDIYYTSYIEEFGAVPEGVNWNGKESQDLRINQLLKVIKNHKFSINDYGCGYGALISYLNKRKYDYYYSGFDISKKMIIAARKKWKHKTNVIFHNSNKILPADYSIVNGVFNVKMDLNEALWLNYTINELKKINENSIKGFAFNMKTKYSDMEFLQDHLFYGDPLFFFDYCKTKFSRFVTLVHDYDLYEFTILVRK
ncbi:MAG: class I SAM-dependent methyltransferase [Melioribacteraceae bacterium]|nr:class I SAM-dependent methyltransferase [Melioribacteraceae bacterium]